MTSLTNHQRLKFSVHTALLSCSLVGAAASRGKEAGASGCAAAAAARQGRAPGKCHEEAESSGGLSGQAYRQVSCIRRHIQFEWLLAANAWLQSSAGMLAQSGHAKMLWQQIVLRHSLLNKCVTVSRESLKWPAKNYPEKVVTLHESAPELAAIRTALQVEAVPQGRFPAWVTTCIARATDKCAVFTQQLTTLTCCNSMPMWFPAS